MSLGFVLLLTFGIGFVAGLRTFTAPAAVAWAAHLGWLSLSGSVLAFMGSTWAVCLFSILALVEFVTDQLPSTPARNRSDAARGASGDGSVLGGVPCHRRRSIRVGWRLFRRGRSASGNLWRL